MSTAATPAPIVAPLETVEHVLGVLNGYQPHDEAIESLANEIEQQRIELLTELTGIHPAEPERAAR